MLLLLWPLAVKKKNQRLHPLPLPLLHQLPHRLLLLMHPHQLQPLLHLTLPVLLPLQLLALPPVLLLTQPRLPQKLLPRSKSSMTVLLHFDAVDKKPAGCDLCGFFYG